MTNVVKYKQMGRPGVWMAQRRSDGRIIGQVQRVRNGRWAAYDTTATHRLGNIHGYPTRDDAAGVLIRRAAALQPES